MARYLLFNKPYGVLSQFTAPQNRPTLKAFIPVPDVYPVGRLDHDSEGLLLLTDDGPWAHRLSDPGHGHPKTYLAQVEAAVPVSAEVLRALSEGVMLSGRDRGRLTLPAKASLLSVEPMLPARPVPIRVRRQIPTAWLSLTLREGRNRQVRRMTAAVGHPTLRLVRVALGPLSLGELLPGDWRELSAQELAQLARGPCGRSRPGRSH